MDIESGRGTLAMALDPPEANPLSLTVLTISSGPKCCLNRLTCVFDGLSDGFFGARGFRGLGGLSGSLGFRFLGTLLDVEAAGVGVTSSREGDCVASTGEREGEEEDSL